MKLEIHVEFTIARKKVVYVTHDDIPLIRVGMLLELDVRGCKESVVCEISDPERWCRKRQCLTIFVEAEEELTKELIKGLEKDNRWKKDEETD